ncbi:hypothetical protein [Hymenobacter sp. BT491]|uniref:hypothetical protein n=1 Tax=Hymenobacter sp. BT491 TaxID=2766779 RepID=UPI00165369BE|nr:hypothetical protein [Hymenobacter sp. BT491]MBC6989313.1 hypothetical protein [Hymenobacter sp. BT491]
MRLIRYSIVVSCLWLMGCTNSQNAYERLVPAPTASQPRRNTTPALDLPALLVQNIDSLRRLIGPPRELQGEGSAAEPGARDSGTAAKVENWVNTFEKNRSTLIVTFNARTRKVVDIVLPGTDEEELMQQANLSLYDSRYIVLPVGDPKSLDRITGLRIIPRR